MKKTTSIQRRNFLKTAAIAAAGVTLAPASKTILASSSTAPTSPSTLNMWPGRVVINFNEAAINGINVDTTVVEKMVVDSILKLTGETAIGAAWKAIFPSTLSATSKIAIKVNTLNSGKPAPHWASVRAITDGLQLMDFSGTKFPAANITIYDMNNQNLSTAGYNAANFPGGINIVTDTAINGGDGALKNRTYAKTLKDANFLINVFGARGHSMPPTGSQFTLGFKSHYGTYSNPSQIHSNWDSNFREIVCTGPVFNKLVLSMCSAIFGTNEGDSPTQSERSYTTYVKTIDSTSTVFGPVTIMMSTDPISIEMQAVKMMRINQGGKYTTADMPAYLRASGGIDVTSLTPTYNIGTIDEAKMDIRKIINAGPTPVLPSASNRSGPSGAFISAHPIAGSGSVFIEFQLPSDHADKEATIEIFNAIGNKVAGFSPKVMGAVNHFSWDKRNSQGSMAAKGVYIVRLSSGLIRQFTQFSIM